MEYLPGADLGALLSAYGPMPVGRAIRFVLQACESLTEAHEAGVIHRDIKPQNIFVTRVGDDFDFVKLLDFGIARIVPSGGLAQRTQTGALRGTPMYMAPELFLGAPADARSDLYALGATLYTLLTGTPPFLGGSPAEIVAAHLAHHVEPPSARRAGAVPPELDAIVLRCLDKDPDGRFQSARALTAALGPLVGGAAWSQKDAERFWHAHVAKLTRMEAPTQ